VDGKSSFDEHLLAAFKANKTKLTIGWLVSKGSEKTGWHWLCGNRAQKLLPLGWKGVCTLGAIVSNLTITNKLHQQKGRVKTFIRQIKKTHNATAERPTGFHSFHSFTRWFLPRLGLSELEKTIVNISAVIENIENRTTDAINALQTEVSSLSKVVIQNRMAVDSLLVSQGGVRTITNTSCCVYVDQIGRISTDREEIWK